MSAPVTPTTSLEDGIRHIAADDIVWVRVAAVRRDDGIWYARLVELTAGAAPPSWSESAWEYPWAVFVATTRSGAAVANWLATRTIDLKDRDIRLPEMSASLMWERRQSRSPASYESLEWPVTETTLAQVDFQAEPSGYLVSGEDAPSFVNFYTAAACFFWLDRQPIGGSLHQGVMYRAQDRRGRLTSVRVSDDEVVVDVEGNRIRGMIVELAGDLPGPTTRLSRGVGQSTGARIPIPDGLPSGAWVLLRNRGEWIDRRSLTLSWARGAEAGVEFLEPRTRLDVFLANREGPEVEFKRQVPSDDAAKAKVMKTVCAFANGGGGSILFGIDDDHNLVGVPARTVGRLEDQITQMVDSWIEPRPRLGFEALPTEDVEKVVLVLRVERGVGLYGCGRRGDQSSFFVRHYATTVRARPAEIEQIVRSRATTAARRFG